MAIATDGQVQNYVNQRIRPHAEQVRNLVNALRDDKATIDDVYAALTQATPTWEDARDDFPPHLLTRNDVLAVNAFITGFLAFIDASAEYAIIIDACVRPV